MGARFGGLVLDTIILAVGSFIVGLIISTAVKNAAFLELVGSLISLGYFGYFVGVHGATPGHRAAGLRVVDVNSGQLIGFWRAVLRSFVLSITGLVCTLGYWSPFFDSTRRQGWHDKAASAVVIPAARRA